MQEFNGKRIVGLIYRNIVLQKGAIITALLVAGGLIFIGSLLSMRGGDHLVEPNEFIVMFSILFLTLGLLFTFSIFKELHNNKVNHFYFLLPTSAYERIIASWLISNVIYIVVFTFFAFIVGQLAIVICSVFPSTNLHVLPVFSEAYWNLVKFYFFAQPAFLLGAVTFSKNRIGKTLLVALITVFCVFMYNLILCFSFTGGAFDVFTSDPFSTDAFSLAKEDLSGLGALLFSIVLGPMMLLAAYFKLTEKEVR
ncbi:hypothetical protein U6A24_03575 [Aquimarina gracilis]|uniref:ABC-2 type transport system permease protein n=1 Tax=Aquimarina gracilis TaxID=874422 RepID=A0ABU5ZRG0_9FLAO|nr:hypothetical protein [Aquimarina gracilis]MEB3344524.1 hypothetical protein [Aquimarina gracilis]